MRELVIIAWRNIVRHGRRSFLTVLSIGVGLAAVLFAQSLLRSFQRQMVDKATGVMLGHVQVQAARATDRKLPDVLLEDPERVRDQLRQEPEVTQTGIRLLFTGLVQAAGGSRGVLVVGVEAENESRLSIIPSYMKQGRYLEGGRDVVLGEKLAGELDVQLGERLVVMAQSADGEMNSELFRVAGLYHTGSVAYDGQIVYIPLAGARRIRARPGVASHIVARLTDARQAERFAQDRRELFGSETRLLHYGEVGSEIRGIKSFQDALLIVMLIIIFAIVGLGILNTISMSFYERIREFGVLRALGARPSVVFQVLVTEAAMMGVLGALCGLILGGTLIGFFGATGLALPVGKAIAYFMPFDDVIFLRPEWGLHAWSALGLFGVCLLAALGPAWRAARLIIVDALHHI
jgi:putative ABC transport system permease protein